MDLKKRNDQKVDGNEGGMPIVEYSEFGVGAFFWAKHPFWVVFSIIMLVPALILDLVVIGTGCLITILTFIFGLFIPNFLFSEKG